MRSDFIRVLLSWLTAESRSGLSAIMSLSSPFLWEVLLEDLRESGRGRNASAEMRNVRRGREELRSPTFSVVVPTYGRPKYLREQ